MIARRQSSKAKRSTATSPRQPTLLPCKDLTMAGKFLIDVTDARFKIAVNDDVMHFVRIANPSAHTDIGIRLLELCKELPGVGAYSPSYKSCAYVVLHTAAHRIFAIAYGQRGLAFCVPPAAQAEALADDGAPATEIGPDWVSFVPYDEAGQAGARERLRRWCSVAYVAAGASRSC